MAKFQGIRSGVNLRVAQASVARTDTAATQKFTLPRGARVLGYILSGTASDAATTATLSIGTTTTATEHVNAFDVKSFSGLVMLPSTATAKLSASLSPALVAANTSAEQLFTVNGVLSTDIITANKPTAQAGLGIVGVRASAANQVGITFGNFTAGGLTPTASETYLFEVTRAQGNIPATMGTILGGGVPNTIMNPIFVKYAETGTASTVGAWKLFVLYTDGNLQSANDLA